LCSEIQSLPDLIRISIWSKILVIEINDCNYFNVKEAVLMIAILAYTLNNIELCM